MLKNNAHSYAPLVTVTADFRHINWRYFRHTRSQEPATRRDNTYFSAAIYRHGHGTLPALRMRYWPAAKRTLKYFAPNTGRLFRALAYEVVPCHHAIFTVDEVGLAYSDSMPLHIENRYSR